MKVKIINSDIYSEGDIYEENETYDIAEKKLEGLSNFYEPLNGSGKSDITAFSENGENVPKRRRGRPRKSQGNNDAHAIVSA